LNQIKYSPIINFNMYPGTIGWLIVFLACSSSHAAPASKPNVLFIAVDDLRPQLGCYGVTWMKTPHMDSLAARGVRFEHHYVQFAVCIPSRVALLTSLRSERTHQVYGPHVWQNVTNASALGRTFSAAGYTTASLGKIWHGKPEGGTRKDGDVFDDFWVPKAASYAGTNGTTLTRKEQRAAKEKDNDEEGAGPFFEALPVPDETYNDGLTAQAAVERLKKFSAKRDQPFLLAVGFHKPHLPFVAPKKYWDLYDRATLPLPPQPDFPKNAPALARNHGIKSFAGLEHGPEARYDEASTRHLIHGYCAATSYADAQIGKVLIALRELGLEKNTIIVLWGDHGWHLGDLQQWAKSTNYERATRSPLIVVAPGQKAGVACERLVETVDIFPTLVELCGLPPLPLTDGKSFAPLLANPLQAWKQAAYHCFDRPSTEKGKKGKNGERFIGYAVRTDKARYIEWHQGWSLDGKLVAREFYRYFENKPDEVANAVDKPDLQEMIAAHAKLLRENPGLRK
jgi:iduronate 2-sulfatase